MPMTLPRRYYTDPEQFRSEMERFFFNQWVYVGREDRCDISIAVADAWQNVMLGTYVVMVLLHAAIARGHTRFSAEVLSSNARMLGLLRELGAPMRSHQDAGVVRLEFELPAATP